jgi:predicted nucleotidyltransferase
MESIKEFAAKILPVLLPYGIKRVAIFGSFARGGSRERHRHLGGVPRAEEKTSGLLAWIRLERKLSQRLGRKVDLVSFAGLRPRLREEIEKEMVVIYEAAE